jgi:hypothetical protein
VATVCAATTRWGEVSNRIGRIVSGLREGEVVAQDGESASWPPIVLVIVTSTICGI